MARPLAPTQAAMPETPANPPQHDRPGAARRWGWLRADPWLLVGLVAVSIAVVVPFWVSDLLPYMDLPQHLAAVRTMHSLNDAAFGLDRYHVIDLSRTQYLAWYFAVDWLTWLMPLEVANRVVLSLYAVGLPLSLVALLRALKRDPAIALAAAPLVHNTFLYMGLANYVTSIPLMFWALALLLRQLERLTLAGMVGLAAVVALMFYSHAQILLLYLGLAAIALPLGGRGWQPRHWWRQALHAAPTLVLLGVWISRSMILAGAAQWQQGHGGRNVTDTQVRFEPIGDRLAAIPGQIMDAFRDDADEKLLLAWLALLLVCWLLGQGRGAAQPADGQAPGWWPTLRARLPELMFVALFAVYVASPLSYKWIWPISHRMVPVLALAATVAVSFARMPLRRTLLIVPAVALAAISAWTHADRARAFTEEAGPVREVLAQAERGRKLVALIFDKGSAVVRHAPYLHFGQYYVVDRGGMATFSFADFPQSPIVYPTVDGPPKLPARWEWTPERFDYDQMGRFYDYYLIRDHPGSNRNPFGRWREEVELVEQQGRWTLYRRKASDAARAPPS